MKRINWEVIRADETFLLNRYDTEGLRAEMEENGRLCRFVFHRGEIISEEAGSESGSYLSSRYIRGNGVEYLEQDGTAYSFQKDEQGSTVFLLNREKEICGAYTYDGFGNLRKNAGFGKHGNRILYAGQQYDGWSEQYYLRAWYYNPKIGRFLQEDTYYDDGLNLYAYCHNNPVTYYDPSGYNQILNCPQLQFADDAVSKNAEFLRTGGNGTTVNVKTKAEAHALLMEAFPDYQKVNGSGSQDSGYPRIANTTNRFSEGGAYHKDYGIDFDTGRVYGHPGNNPHGEYPHINIKRTDGKKVLINITGRKNEYPRKN